MYRLDIHNFVQIGKNYFYNIMLYISKLKKVFIISLIFITFVGCDDNDEWIPNVRVNLWLDLNTQLATLGLLQARIIQGEGVNGLIIFRLQDREFNAFDRTCPYRPSDNCKVEFVEEELSARCPCCESEFELFFNGAVKKGPAKRPLKQYRTSIVGSQLNIFN